MRSAFVLSPAARQDLMDIWEFIAQDNIEAADRVISEIKSAMTKLAKMPGMGTVRNDLADEPLRIWPIYSYLIVYRERAMPLEIVRVVSGYRDIETLF